MATDNKPDNERVDFVSLRDIARLSANDGVDNEPPVDDGLAELLAKATPGPWSVDEGGIRCDHAHSYGVVAQVCGGQVYSEYTSDSATLEFANDADEKLTALAPTLAREVLALRAAIASSDENVARTIRHEMAAFGIGFTVSQSRLLARAVLADIREKADGGERTP